jgi:hypothetical protein
VAELPFRRSGQLLFRQLGSSSSDVDGKVVLQAAEALHLIYISARRSEPIELLTRPDLFPQHVTERINDGALGLRREITGRGEPSSI